MSKIDDIQKAVEQLSPEELAKFREWFEEFEERLWDEQIVRDLEAGKLDKLLSEVRANVKAGVGEEF